MGTLSQADFFSFYMFTTFSFRIFFNYSPFPRQVVRQVRVVCCILLIIAVEHRCQVQLLWPDGGYHIKWFRQQAEYVDFKYLAIRLHCISVWLLKLFVIWFIGIQIIRLYGYGQIMIKLGLSSNLPYEVYIWKSEEIVCQAGALFDGIIFNHKNR